MSRVAVRATVGGFAVAAALLAGVPGPVRAQVPTLDRIDSLITAGQYADARSTLEQWWSAREAFEVPGSDRARALMLRARLAPDPDTAEPDYLAIVLGYPTSPQAPEALLRLGQGLLADGDAVRAVAYLQRLVADYPGRPERLTGLLWLARANAAARRFGTACQVARQGLQDSRDRPELTALLQEEETTACSVAAGDRDAEAAPAVATPAADPRAREPAAERAAAPPPRPEPRPAAPPATTDRQGRFTVQSGAFRYRETADALVQRLRGRGYEPRLVLVPDNDLLRVRIGRFATSAEAVALVSVLRSSGFDAIVVADARQERSP